MAKRPLFTNEMIYDALSRVLVHLREIGSNLVSTNGLISDQSDTLENIRKRLDTIENTNHDDPAP